MAADKKQKIDELVAKAAESNKQSAFFEAERMCVKALAMARHAGDFTSMASILPMLRDVRQARLKQAQSTAGGGKGRITLLKAAVTEDMKIARGCYLVSPPQVGADARRLRLAAFEAEIPVAVVCREPRTQSGMVPVVAISAGATVRVKIEPPENDEKPEREWFIGALNQLGEHAVASLDVTLPAVRKVDALLERLDAIPEHAGIHDALARACEEAAREPQPTKKLAAGKAAIDPDGEDFNDDEGDDDGEDESPPSGGRSPKSRSSTAVD